MLEVESYMNKDNVIVCRDSLAEQEEEMSCEYITVLFFQELLELEKLLCGGRRMRIVRSTDGKLVVSVYCCGESKAEFTHTVKLKDLHNARQVMDEVSRLFSALLEARCVEPM